jgi:hypothetical protein
MRPNIRPNMGPLVHVLLVLLLGSTALAENKIICTHYIYQNVPFATITLHQDASGSIDRYGEITHFGQTKTTAIEEHAAQVGELYNLTVEADSNGGELGLIISQRNDVNGKQAKLINPASPMMKEMPGSCVFGQSNR